jgi:hypothetical protein
MMMMALANFHIFFYFFSNIPSSAGKQPSSYGRQKTFLGTNSNSNSSIPQKQRIHKETSCHPQDDANVFKVVANAVILIKNQPQRMRP